MPRVIGFHYTLRDDLGETLDSSDGGAALHFIEGSGQIIPGLERQVLDLPVGTRQVVDVPAAEAYGEMRPELHGRVPRSNFPKGAPLDIGAQFTLEMGDQAPIFTIVDVDDDTVTVDANHPLAGQDLHFDLEIVTVRDATADEVKMGRVLEIGGPRR